MEEDLETEETEPEEELEETIVYEEFNETYNATTYVTSAGYEFYLSSSQAVISGYTKSGTELTFPSSVTLNGNSYPVTSIADYAFDGKTSITKVVFPRTITKVGYAAFRGCISLSSLSLNEGLATIGNYGFNGCSSLKSVVLPSTVNSIGSQAFANCISLTTANVKCPVMGYSMFDGCKTLKTVTLSESIAEIPNYSFQNCVSLTSVNIPKVLNKIGQYAFFGCTALPSISLNEGLVSLGYRAFSSCSSLESVVIPSTVTSIDQYVFTNDTGLTAVNLKNTFTGANMFEGCTGLRSITFSNNFNRIGNYSFHKCTALSGIRFPSKLTDIGSYAFWECNALTTLQIPSSVVTLGNSSFSGCANLKKVEVDATTIGISAFNGCASLTTVIMGDNVATVGERAFASCQLLQNVTFGANVIELGTNCFQSCTNLKVANIGPKVVTIGERAFSSSGLESVVIPASVKVIGNRAFYNCANLKNVSLVNGLTTISDYAFYFCGALNTIYIPQSVVSMGSNCFANSGLGKGTVYCERNSTAANSSLYPTGTKIVYGKPVAHTPTFVVKGVINGRNVTFNCEDKDAVVYYSTSSNMTTSDKSVAAGSTVTFSNFYGTIYARAYYNGQWSNVARLILKIPVVNTPTITESKGMVKISTTTPSCIIYYTTDGTTPSPSNGTKVNASSTTFSATGGTIKAIAVRSCFTNSDVASKKLSSTVSSSIKVPSFNVKGVIGGRTVTFSSATKGAVIYYSTSSSMTTNGNKVANGKSVTFENFYGTIYARAYYNGQWSNVARLILKIPVVNTPTISKSAGYATITTSTPNCTIYYTTDGSKPSPTNGRRINASSGRVYVGYGVTVRAVAVRSCFTNSEIATK